MSDCRDDRLYPGDVLYGVHKRTGRVAVFRIHKDDRYSPKEDTYYLLIECLSHPMGWKHQFTSGYEASVNALNTNRLSIIQVGLHALYAEYVYSKTVPGSGAEMEAVKGRIVQVEDRQITESAKVHRLTQQVAKLEAQVSQLAEYTPVSKPACPAPSDPGVPNLSWMTGTPPQYVPIEREGMHGFYVRVNMMYYRVVSHGPDSTRHQLLSVDFVGAEYGKWRVVRDLPSTPQHLPWRGSLCIIQEVDKCEPPALAVFEADAFYKWMPLSSTPAPDRRCVGSGRVSAFLVLS